MTAFLRSEDVRREQFDWGVIGWRCTPEAVGAKQLVVMDVEISPGAGHDFHRHPVQEELITVGSGEIEQWVAEEVNVLGPGTRCTSLPAACTPRSTSVLRPRI